MDNIIELKNINKIYGSKVKSQVLFDINLEIKSGSFVSIIGQSGSGKSTILNIIGTLDNPTSGEIIINGTNTKDLNSNKIAALRNQTIGFIFQFHYLLPEFNVLENIIMPVKIAGRKVTNEDLSYARELLKIIGLSKYEKYKINMLSGGQQQRVAIARALMNKPALLLADEPTGNLDSKGTQDIYELLRKINNEFKTTFIVITHDRKVAERADRIIEIKDGQIELDVTI